MKRILAVALASLVLVGAAGAAYADEDALDTIAESRFKEGVAAAKQGDYERARASFLQTLALSPNAAKVFLNLAIVEHAAGRSLDALGHLKTYLAHPKANPTKVADLKKSLFAELWGATGHLRIVATGGETIVLDRDTKLGNAPLGDIVDVSPGAHAVTAGARSINVDVAAGETKDVSLVPETPPKSAREPASPTPEPAASESNLTRNVVAGSLAVVGLTGLGLGLGFAFAANAASDDLHRAKAETGTGPNACAGVQSPACEARAEHADALERNRALMWTGIIAGGVAVAGAAVTFFFWPRPSDRASPPRSARVLSPWIGPSGAGFSFQGDL